MNNIDYKHFFNNASDQNEWYQLASEMEYSASVLRIKWDTLFTDYALSVNDDGELEDEDLDTFSDLISVEKSYNFLMALSIENFIKGKLIEHDPNRICITAKINPNTNEIIEAQKIEYGWSHSISQLAKQLSKISEFELTESEEKTLVYLEETIIWGGRYPAPVSFKAKAKDPLMELTGKRSDEIQKIYQKLFELDI